jgi:hypothetical protein
VSSWWPQRRGGGASGQGFGNYAIDKGWLPHPT